MLLPQRIGHRRFHAYRAGHFDYRGPGASARLAHRLVRWLRKQAGRRWADVQEEFDEKVRQAAESDEVRRDARRDVLLRLTKPHRELRIDPDTGRLVWDPKRFKRSEPVTYSAQELLEGKG